MFGATAEPPSATYFVRAASGFGAPISCLSGASLWQSDREVTAACALRLQPPSILEVDATLNELEIRLEELERDEALWVRRRL